MVLLQTVIELKVQVVITYSCIDVSIIKQQKKRLFVSYIMNGPKTRHGKLVLKIMLVPGILTT